MSLVVYGPSKMGKTVWARSLGNHIYFCGLYSYAEAIKAEEVDYAVFDDIQGGIKFFPAFKNWLGAQKQFQVKGLYRDPQLITWGKPSIWLANRDPRDQMYDGLRQDASRDSADNDVAWLEANCIFVELASPIFHANTE